MTEISSLLSKTQRKWVKKESGAADSPPRVVKHRIKERYQQAIKDLELLHESDQISDAELREWRNEVKR